MKSNTKFTVFILAAFFWPLTALGVISNQANIITSSSGVPGDTVNLLDSDTGEVLWEGETGSGGQLRICVSEDDEQQDEDGIPCAFMGDSARNATIEIGDESASVGWDGSSITSLTPYATALATTSGWTYGFSAAVGSMNSDHLSGWAEEGMQVLGTSEGFNTDDSSSYYSLEFMFRKQLRRGTFFSTLRYIDGGSFDARFEGPVLGGTLVNELSTDVTGYGIDVGCEYPLGGLWSWFFGADVTVYDLDESGSVRFTEGGRLVSDEKFSGSEDQTELGLFLGAAYSFGDNWQLRGRARYHNEVFNDEDITELDLGIAYLF